MRDMLGVEVQVGDIILACAGTGGGLAKLGEVYSFDKNGWPMVRYFGVKWDTGTGRYKEMWAKGSAGAHVLVVESQDGSTTDELEERLSLIRETGMG